MSKSQVLCVNIDRTDDGWRSDVYDSDDNLIVGQHPTEIAQRLIELGFTIASSSYSETYTGQGNLFVRHVVWMIRGHSIDLKALRVRQA